MWVQATVWSDPSSSGGEGDHFPREFGKSDGEKLRGEGGFSPAKSLYQRLTGISPNYPISSQVVPHLLQSPTMSSRGVRAKTPPSDLSKLAARIAWQTANETAKFRL
ncbi:hypothetical protein PABG_11513 [Paracoccidioides brasiliensis Pb03]|nr:hypothetical protein PABG_11513 [Paracoccidioides brasiliensis Pb03]